jgi:hypothetical protein
MQKNSSPINRNSIRLDFYQQIYTFIKNNKNHGKRTGITRTESLHIMQNNTEDTSTPWRWYCALQSDMQLQKDTSHEKFDGS